MCCLLIPRLLPEITKKIGKEKKELHATQNPMGHVFQTLSSKHPTVQEPYRVNERRGFIEGSRVKSLGT